MAFGLLRRRGGTPLLLVSLLLAGSAACRDGDVPPPGGPEAEADVRPGGTDATPGEDPGGEATLRLRDWSGRAVVLPEPPERIVSLVPAATQALLELGAGDRLVGRTDFDRDPRVAHLPSVGGGIGPSIEHVVRLAPDLVVRFEGEQDRGTPPLLERAGIPHLGVRPDRIEDVREMVRLLGRATGHESEAEELVAAMDAELAAVQVRVADLERPRVAFLLGGDPPWVATGDTFLHELLEIAGGENVLAGAGTLYAPVSVEEIVRRDVDLLLAPESATIPGALARIPLRRLPDAVQSPGVGLAASARHISRAVHPERWR
jgi:iron complex transport system substrate-binding protein